MIETEITEPVWNGKQWQELTRDEWTCLRTTNIELWHEFVQASEPRKAKAAPLAAPTPVPTADPSPEYVRPEEVYPRFLRPFLSGIAKVLKEVKDKTDARIVALENRTASTADASVVATDQARIKALADKLEAFETRFATLSTKLDKTQQQLSATQKHVQSVERKIGSPH